MPRQYTRLPVVDRLMRHSRRENGHLLWTGCIDRRGYGRIGVGGKKSLVPRIAYEAFVGPIPEGLQVHHLCNTPACFEPTHLTVGTQKQNLEYMVECGRSLKGMKRPPDFGHKGELNPQAKLTTTQVSEIRRRFAAGEKSGRQLAFEYGIHPTTMGEIIRRETWGHID